MLCTRTQRCRAKGVAKHDDFPVKEFRVSPQFGYSRGRPASSTWPYLLYCHIRTIRNLSLAVHDININMDPATLDHQVVDETLWRSWKSW